MSPVVDATTEPTRAEAVAQAVAAVRDGSLVVLPTDTVYGIGCDAFDAAAVGELLAAKGRGRDVPPPVLIGQVRTLDGIATDIQPYVRDLVERFWPGALTVVLQAQPSLHWDLGETEGTVAVRMPDDPIALAVLAETGPMAVTSANLHGRPAATTVLDAATQLGAAVAVYVDGGPRATQQPSTILDCTGPAPVVLRAGAISEDDLSAIAALASDVEASRADAPADAEASTAADADVATPIDSGTTPPPSDAQSTPDEEVSPRIDAAEPSPRHTHAEADSDATVPHTDERLGDDA